MSSHIFATLSLTCVLMLGVIGTASAYNGERWGDRNEWSHGRWDDSGGHKSFGGDPSAPELDPMLLGSGAAILAGGMIILNERRRKRE